MSYSKKGSELDTVTSVDKNDRLLVSVSSDGQTYNTTNIHVGTMTDQIKNSVEKELATKTNTNNGLVGSGTIDNPVTIDSSWTDARFYRNLNFPFSQVGLASDFTLPISGSYFSVSYPYSAKQTFQIGRAHV